MDEQSGETEEEEVMGEVVGEWRCSTTEENSIVFFLI